MENAVATHDTFFYKDRTIVDVNEGEGHQVASAVTLPAEAAHFDVILFLHGICEGAKENIKYMGSPRYFI